MSSTLRQQLVQELMLQFRYASANSVLFSQVLADKVGLHPTDNECLDYLLMNGAATAGQLALLTGLTTGAVTAVIDRLEKAGYVKRQPDTRDRRKVIVVPNTEKAYADIMPHAQKMGSALDAICGDFSEAELDTINRFMNRANAAAQAVITDVRETK